LQKLLVFNCYSKDTDISQGSVRTHFMYGGIYSNSFITNCLLILRVKKFLKLVNNWRFYSILRMDFRHHHTV